MGNIIEIKNLTKTYGQNRGVTDVSFSVSEGEIFGFLGQNGAGKSTTIRSMLGLIKYNSGSISIFGKDSVGAQEEILKNVGYMPSEAQFYPDMTVGKVIQMAQKVRKVDCVQEAQKLCNRLGLDVNKKIRELSLGNRKKVSIVCAMQHKPKLFIFDEPTSGLDPLMQATFFELIKEYVEQGTTCMLSTHVLSEVKNNCDRVAIMKEGKLLCTDTVENLTKSNSKKVKVCVNGEQKEYLYGGDINDLLKDLSRQNVSDLLIEEPSIEEIFMHYYEKN